MAEIEIRLDESGEIDEVVAKGVDVHLERMDHGHWWISIGGVTVTLFAARPSRTKIRGRWENEDGVDTVTVSRAGE